MDSMSQLLLGASVSVAVMGRRTAVWKAALWGGIAGTLPDLDTFIDHGDAVLNMVLHRAETHAFFYHLLASFPLAWLVAVIHRETALWRRWWIAMLLVLTTHALLDAFTVYGTQLLLPFSNHPFGVGSLFIIDPAYTLPLLVGVLGALVWRHAGLRLNHFALMLSTAYIGWSVGAQAWVKQHARESLAQAGLPTEQVLVTPAPFTTLLWRVVSMGDSHYHEGYYALLDQGRPIVFRSHDRGGPLLQRYADHAQVQQIAAFSKGFYRLREVNGQLLLADLRMGQEPAYGFEFALDRNGSAGQPTQPAIRVGRRADPQIGLPWLLERVQGQDLPPLSDRLLPPVIPAIR
ncbi:MAG: metal-dependent hydrolase [Burkholderiaceae bacterium]|nr:metal-dependent hydrolase [Burkholderiaceae bacterium]